MIICMQFRQNLRCRVLWLGRSVMECPNRDLSFWTPVNFEVEYFLNEETEDVLTDTVIYLYDQHLTCGLVPLKGLTQLSIRFELR